MNRIDITELHFITPIANVPSILEHGILSNHRARDVSHSSMAMREVQERRANKQIPGARSIRDYANLYFDAHNPMLSKRRSHNHKICVLQIDAALLDLPEVIIADRNAASDWVRFYSVKEGLVAIDKEMLFARYWTHPGDPYTEMEHKSVKCAEVLIPDRVDPSFIHGAYVVGNEALDRLQGLNMRLSMTIKADMFF